MSVNTFNISSGFCVTLLAKLISMHQYKRKMRGLVNMTRYSGLILTLITGEYLSFEVQISSYSPSHIVQISDFTEFLHDYCKEKS